MIGSPTSQFQCDQDKLLANDFWIDAFNNILYHASPTFFACPAPDTGYNIYVDANIDHTECFAITLKASCCSANVLSSCVLPSTIWQTQTAIEDVTQTVTITTTSSKACGGVPPTTWLNSTVCPQCIKSQETHLTDVPPGYWKR